MSEAQQIPMWQIENLFYLADENKDGKTTFAELIKYLIAKGFTITNETFDKLFDFFTIPMENLKEELFSKYYPRLNELDEDKKELLLKNIQETSGDTGLTLFKVNKCLHQQGIPFTQQDLGKLMDTFAIDLQEFLTVFKQLFPQSEVLLERTSITEEEVEALFKSIDTDGNGQLDLNEIVSFLAKNGYKFRPSQCEELIRKHDYNNDKQLNQAEFAALVTELLKR